MATSPQFVNTVNNGKAMILNADSTAVKDVFTAGTSGSRIERLIITSIDTIAHHVMLMIDESASVYGLASIIVPASTNGELAQVNVLRALFPDDADPALTMQSGEKLTASVTTAVTGSGAVYVMAFGGDF
jgi:hypothetical protein